MAEQFGATPPNLRSTSGDLHDTSSHVKAVKSGLRANLAAEGAAWGGGDLGDGFANGSNGYLAQSDWVDGSVDAKTDLLDYYAAMLKLTADSVEQSDEA